MKREKIEYAIWIVGLVAEFILMILMKVFSFNLGFASTLLWAVMFLALAIFYFATREHEMLGLLFTGYAVLLATVLFKMVTRKVFIISFITWSAICGLIYLAIVSAVIRLLWKRLTGQDDYHKYLRKEEEEKRKKEAADKVEL